MGFLPVVCNPEQLEEDESKEDEEITVYRLTLSTTVPLESSVQVTADLEGREERRKVRHEAMKEELESQQRHELNVFAVSRKEFS